MQRFLVVLFSVAFSARAEVISFGTGLNQFSVDFVEIGSPNNPADSRGWHFGIGAVSYGYSIAKYEISRELVLKVNAQSGLGITLENFASRYTTGLSQADIDSRPATGVSWNEAARFVNWLNTSQGFSHAYKFLTSGVNDPISVWTSSDQGFNPSNPFRNSLARFFLPSSSEWHKAAYFNPSTSTYSLYPTQSDSVPASGSGSSAGNYAFYNMANTIPVPVAEAGSVTYYGTLGQGGNAWEWIETNSNLDNLDPSAYRKTAGGSFGDGPRTLESNYSGTNTDYNENGIGFRVAMVPEPSSLSLLLAGGAVALSGRRKS